MRSVVIIVATIAVTVSPVRAQQGPAFPVPGSNRGPNFPASVSPTESNPTNWIARQHEYTDPSGPNSQWNRWYARGRRGRWGR
jgi:hypothetical protein